MKIDTGGLDFTVLPTRPAAGSMMIDNFQLNLVLVPGSVREKKTTKPEQATVMDIFPMD